MRDSGLAAFDAAAAEVLVAGGFGVAGDELAELVDDGDGGKVALTLRLAPGEEAVAAEDDAVAAGGFCNDLRSIMPSSKPGRCQGSHASLWPNSC